MNQVVIRWGLSIVLLVGFAALVITGTGSYHKNHTKDSAEVELTIVADAVPPLEELTEPIEPLITVAYWQIDAQSKDWHFREREQRWRKNLASRRIQLSVIRELSDLNEITSKTLILADAENLRRTQLAEVYKLLRRGYKIVMTGWVAKDTDKNYRQMKQLLGVHKIVSLPKEKSYFVTAGERSRFNAGTLPGARIDLGTIAEVPAVQLSNKQSLPGAWYWSKWRLKPQETISTAFVARQIDSGHLVWLGFHPELIQPDPDSQKAARALFSSLADFFLNQATVELAPWPKSYRSAALFAMDTEDKFGNAEEVYQLSKKNKLPITYFILGKDAEQHQDLVSKLSTDGEIASHSYLHDSYEENARDIQEKRLSKVRTQLTEMGYADAIGFRPPYEAYNSHTVPALVKNGFKYMAGDTNLASMAIRTVTLSDNSVFYLIPRSFIDDYEVLDDLELQSEKDILALIRPDIALAHHNQGLYYFSFHTQMFAIPKRLKILEKIMNETAREHVWVATAKELVEWWRLRSEINVETSQENNAVSITVVNQGDEVIPPFSLYLYSLPKTVARIKEDSSEIKIHNSEDRAELRFGELRSNSTVHVSLELAQP